MIRAALDSNLLVYAALEPQTDKGRQAQALITRVVVRGIIANQALLEFTTVVRRRAPDLLPQAIAQVEAWSQSFETAATTDRVVAEALAIVQQHQFQIWDAVIWSASQQAGASVLFTQDLQHGFAKDGLRALNPFALDAASLQTVIDG